MPVPASAPQDVPRLFRPCPPLRRRTRHVLSVLPSLRDSAHGSPLCVSSHLATVLPDDGPHRPPLSLPQPHTCSQRPGPHPSPIRQHTARLLFVHSREHLGPPWYRAVRTAICHLVVCRSASRHIGPSSPPLQRKSNHTARNVQGCILARQRRGPADRPEQKFFQGWMGGRGKEGTVFTKNVPSFPRQTRSAPTFRHTGAFPGLPARRQPART